jgi:hypothetical protein
MSHFQIDLPVAASPYDPNRTLPSTTCGDDQMPWPTLWCQTSAVLATGGDTYAQTTARTVSRRCGHGQCTRRMRPMNDDLTTLTDDELARVGGGFLPLLGLLGAGSGLVGNILNKVGQSKVAKAEKELAAAGGGNSADAGATGTGSDGGAAVASAAPTGGNMMAQPIARQPSGGST